MDRTEPGCQAGGCEVLKGMVSPGGKGGEKERRRESRGA